MKKFSLRGLFLSATSMLFLSFHYPKAISNTANPVLVASDSSILPASPIANATTAGSLMYDSLQLEKLGLSEEVFNYAMKGYTRLKNAGKLVNDRIISIIDFTQPSYKKRLFIIDVSNFRLLFNTYVAHGQNTGKEFAKAFSNKPESHQSSLGFYVTSGTYNGSNGYSMYLKGMENGFNNLAYERAIVMHGADYVSEQYIRSQGYIGRSHGCPAVPEKLNKPIIEKIKNGTCLFIFSNNKSYLKKSRLINS